MHANNREFGLSDKMHAGERAGARGGVERERSVAVFLQRSGEELGHGERRDGADHHGVEADAYGELQRHADSHLTMVFEKPVAHQAVA